LLADLKQIAGERLAKGEKRRQTYRDNLLAKQDVTDNNNKALRRSLQKL
jgi:hypothetical protein